MVIAGNVQRHGPEAHATGKPRYVGRADRRGMQLCCVPAEARTRGPRHETAPWRSLTVHSQVAVRFGAAT
jgi:hypothetical protein